MRKLLLTFCLFQFNYLFSNEKPSTTDGLTPDERTKPDGNLKLSIGKINVVFVYRFIAELMVNALVSVTIIM